MIFYLYTDGATSNNGKYNAKGGWAAVCFSKESNSNYNENFLHFQLTGNQMPTTNQRMELTAALRGLEAVSPILKFEDKVILRTDSAYLCNCAKNKWYLSWERNGWKNSKKEPVANQDLWEKIIPFLKNPQIEIEKVKGHSNDYWNEYVDDLAVSEREKLI